MSCVGITNSICRGNRHGQEQASRFGGKLTKTQRNKQKRRREEVAEEAANILAKQQRRDLTNVDNLYAEIVASKILTGKGWLVATQPERIEQMSFLLDLVNTCINRSPCQFF